MAQPVETTLIESHSIGEVAVGKLLRQGVYFEELLAVLRDYLLKHKIRLLQYEQTWIVAKIINKKLRQREMFSTVAEAVKYALELYDKHEAIQSGE